MSGTHLALGNPDGEQQRLLLAIVSIWVPMLTVVSTVDHLSPLVSTGNSPKRKATMPVGYLSPAHLHLKNQSYCETLQNSLSLLKFLGIKSYIKFLNKLKLVMNSIWN